MKETKNTHGGARAGAGRKKKEPTATISFRVKKKHVEAAKKKIQPIVDKINLK